MKFKDVNLQHKNLGFESVFENKNQIFLIDANIFIPLIGQKKIVG